MFVFARNRHPVRDQNVVLRLTPVEKASLWLIAEEDGLSASEILRLGLDLYVRKRRTDRQPLSSDQSSDQT